MLFGCIFGVRVVIVLVRVVLDFGLIKLIGEKFKCFLGCIKISVFVIFECYYYLVVDRGVWCLVRSVLLIIVFFVLVFDDIVESLLSGDVNFWILGYVIGFVKCECCDIVWVKVIIFVWFWIVCDK